MKLNWGNYIFIFIILFLTLCTIFIIFSLRQNIDLVTDDYYEEGADYSSEMKLIDRSAVYSDSITLIQEEDQLEIIPARSLRTVVSSLNIWFYRPSDKDNDFKTEIIITNEPLIISKNRLVKGRYIMHVSWEIKGEEFVIKKNIFIN